MAGSSSDGHYEVLNPCGETEPVMAKAISSRLSTLEGRKIGLFANFKRAARPVQLAVQKRLGERFPSASFPLYQSQQPAGSELEGENREKFLEWLKDTDTLIVAIGD